jgi:hypothetical protein
MLVIWRRRWWGRVGRRGRWLQWGCIELVFFLWWDWLVVWFVVWGAARGRRRLEWLFEWQLREQWRQ